MISVEEASRIVLSHLHTPGIAEVRLDDATGMTLAEDIIADRDFPPFDRVMMDGIAIDAAAFSTGKHFFVGGTQFAGSPPLRLASAGECLEVMTGAMLPAGADAVIRYEDVMMDGKKATPSVNTVKAFQNIQRQGTEVKYGEVVLPKGVRIGTAEIGVLATVGKDKVRVYRPMTVAIVSTGDELVPVQKTPQRFQIRQSNNHVLKAALSPFNIRATIYHLNDDEEKLEQKLGDILKNCDTLILSGGVSKGKKDYVPGVLERLGVIKLFHRVAQRPAKPFWFGKKAEKVVFALPGNPVSCFLGYYKYVAPWIQASLGLKHFPTSAVLAEAVAFEPPLTYFLPVATSVENGQLTAYPVKGKGSGDLANLTKVNGFLELPPDKSHFDKGEIFPLLGTSNHSGF